MEDVGPTKVARINENVFATMQLSAAVRSWTIHGPNLGEIYTSTGWVPGPKFLVCPGTPGPLRPL